MEIYSLPLWRKKKQTYYDKYFERNWNNIKNTWKGIKSLISLKTVAFHVPTILSLDNGDTITVGQTTQIDVSLSIYVLVGWSTYRMSWKCKIDTSFDLSNPFFLNWLSSWEFCKEIFSQNWKEDWNKEIHRWKRISPFKTQVISFLNLKHIIETGGMSLILNLIFYVFKGKQLK